jgi:hypothetical protein
MPDVRFGSLAEVKASNIDVRFTPESGHLQRTHPCPLWANSGLMRCSKMDRYSITSSARSSTVGAEALSIAAPIVRNYGAL